jgi:hypothetical protein
MDFSAVSCNLFTNTTSFMSIGENAVLNKLNGLLSYQITATSKLDACILQNMSPLSGPSIAKVSVCGHPFLLVLVVHVVPTPFNIKSQNNLGEAIFCHMLQYNLYLSTLLEESLQLNQLHKIWSLVLELDIIKYLYGHMTLTPRY